MHILPTTLLLLLPSLLTLSQAHPSSSKPPFFLLAGDSTTAPQAPSGGGWGTGFLSLLIPPANGTNLAQNGATTVSFRQRGTWGKVLGELRRKKKEEEEEEEEGRSVYVTLQFGHNDQKADKGISVDVYRENLGRMVREVREGGGVAVLVTPLTRRSFSSSSNKVADSLHDQRLATIEAGTSTHAIVLDLNAESARYVDALGPDKAHKYNAKEGDTSHLNAEGSRVFGRMVADLLMEREKGLERWIKRDERMSGNIKAGRPG